LEALLTDICIIEDLASDWYIQKGGREGPYTRFEVYFDVLWAIRMGSPQRRSHSNNTTIKVLSQYRNRK
jgi:hypothetical protein